MSDAYENPWSKLLTTKNVCSVSKTGQENKHLLCFNFPSLDVTNNDLKLLFEVCQSLLVFVNSLYVRFFLAIIIIILTKCIYNLLFTPHHVELLSLILCSRKDFVSCFCLLSLS